MLTAARRHTKHFVAFDMAAAAEQGHSAISAVMFGALAGSGALPFVRAAFIEAMSADGKGTDANLSGFSAGLEGAQNANSGVPLLDNVTTSELPAPTSEQGRALRARVIAELPACCHPLAIEGVRRLVDFQDYAYAATYLDRLAQLRLLDHERNGWKLTHEAARYLALFMAYDDTIRVADLKSRETRHLRIRAEVGAGEDQTLRVTDFMHPRFRELCDTLPRPIGRRLLHSRWAVRLLSRFFQKGRFIESTSVLGFGLLLCLASLRRWRRVTLRHADQQMLIVSWLELAQTVAATDPEAALEIIRCQRLIKGYGETYENGLIRFSSDHC